MPTSGAFLCCPHNLVRFRWVRGFLSALALLFLPVVEHLLDIIEKMCDNILEIILSIYTAKESDRMILLLIIAVAGFLCGWITYKPPEKKKAQEPPYTMYDVKKAERDRKQAAKKKQATEDIEHLKENLKLLYPLLDAAKAKYQDATDDKEIEKLTKQIISLQNKIHAAESKNEKSEFIIKYGG